MILAQTPFPGFEIPEANDCTVPQLLELVAPKGAQVLVRGIRDRLYVPPLKDVGWFRETDDVDKLRHAPKITTEDKHIDWDSWTAEDILRRTRIISPLWNMATCKEYSARQKSVKRDEKRIIWTKGFQPFAEIADPDRISGVPFADWQSYGAHLLVKTCDGKLLKISDATVEGENSLPAWLAATRASMVAVQDRSFIGSFLEKLR
ncbi:Methionyl-tRNA formyltransferase [Acarospora aff. strigata]|nr:Methionyl-tRNA formyltransferase [Acarospora aff. strigata]